MTRLIIRLAGILVALFSVVMVLIQARPYDDGELRAFLLPPKGCPAPCWLGLRPGITTQAEAAAILESYSWMNTVETAWGSTDWYWNGNQPTFIISNRGLYLDIKTDNRIHAVSVSPDLLWGDIWLTYGKPDYVIPQVGGVPGYAQDFYAWYSDYYLSVGFLDSCGLGINRLWLAPVFALGIDDDPVPVVELSTPISDFTPENFLKHLKFSDCHWLH